VCANKHSTGFLSKINLLKELSSSWDGRPWPNTNTALTQPTFSTNLNRVWFPAATPWSNNLRHVVSHRFASAGHMAIHSFTCKHAIAAFTPQLGWYSFYRPTQGRRLSLLGWLVTYQNKVSPWESNPDTITHLSTNRAQHRLTSLIKTNALPLHQSTTAVLDLDSVVMMNALLCVRRMTQSHNTVILEGLDTRLSSRRMHGWGVTGRGNCVYRDSHSDITALGMGCTPLLTA